MTQEIPQEIPLNNPAWHALTGRHQDAIAVRHGRAARYRSDVSVIAALEKGDRSAFADLAQIVEVGETIGVIVDPDMVPPKDWHIVDELRVIQMTCDGLTNERVGECVRLGDADIPEMMALAKLTNPGPFAERTIDMGLYFGIRIDGRLAAMAGERMHLEGCCEVSGVCSHPDFRGRGLAQILVSHVTRTILDRGEVPFLHALKSSETFNIARGTYEKLGFKTRRDLCMTVLKRV